MWLHRCGISVLILTKLYNCCLAGFLGKTRKPKSPAFPHHRYTSMYGCAILPLRYLSSSNHRKKPGLSEEHIYDGRERNGLIISSIEWARSEKDLLPDL